MIDFPPVRGSIFDDPGDEKSWYVSQRSEDLIRYYGEREPSWYASAVAPLRGAERVLDLGCGPGLALQALLEQGSSEVLGVDRWPAFVARGTPTAPIVAHDLTLPMPFLESASFDGVLSHYALDYVSPICLRQVLREVHRLLAPGGLLVIYVAAVGVGGGDGARTAAYSPAAVEALLAEAGFDEIDVEASSDGRNSVARARRAGEDRDVGCAHPHGVRASIVGDTQLSTSFCDAGDRVEFEIAGSHRRAVLALDLPLVQSPDETRVSLCARALPSASGGTDLQIWAWRGRTPVASECVRFELAATEMRVNCSEGVEHVAVWSPGELSLEPFGNACARSGDLPPGGDLSEAERGAEGRQIVVERPAERDAAVHIQLGPGRNRFLLRRASGVDPSTIDRAWLAGRAHGIVFAADELDGEQGRDLLLWAGWRQALVFIGGSDWEGILAATIRREAELRSPVALVDPALDGELGPRFPPPEAVDFVEAKSRFFLLLGNGSKGSSTSSGGLERLGGRMLHGGPPDEDETKMHEANETLRYLTERTLLMRLRQTHRYSPAEVGRRRALP